MGAGAAKRAGPAEGSETHMDFGGANWALITIIGPLVLAVVLAWAIVRNRRGRAEDARSEREVSEAYDREEKARREADGDS